MREYRDQSELMAVFTRPAARSLVPGDFGFIAGDVQVLVRLLQKPSPTTQAVGVNVLLYGPPGTGKTELAKVVAQAAGLELFEVEYADRDGNSLSGRDRYRSMQIAPGVSQGRAAGGIAVRRGGRRVPARQRDAAGLMARAEQQALAAAVSHSGQRQGLGQSDPRIQPGADDLGHQPHRADRPGVPPPLRLPPGASSPRRPARASSWCARRWTAWPSAKPSSRLTGRKGLTPAQIPHRRALCRLAHSEALAEGGFEA